MFKRAFLVSLLVSELYLVFHNLTVGLGSGLAFDFAPTALANQLREMAPNLGWIFAGVYTALYTRFASQWSYLADLYNQIKAAQCQIEGKKDSNPEAMSQWKAGFIEDAYDLHLINKRNFAVTAWEWSGEPEVLKQLSKNGPLASQLREVLIAVGVAARPDEPVDKIEDEVDTRMRRLRAITEADPASGQSDPPQDLDDAA